MRSLMFGLVVLAAACIQTVHVFAQQINVLDAGTQSQLFVDGQIVYSSERVAFTPHAAVKHPQNPILKADKPWEGWSVTAFNCTVSYDEAAKRFRMWYRAAGKSEYFDDAGICYAESADGLHWEKPLVGTIAAKNGKPHNVVSPFLSPSVFYDAADADASRRYKMVCFDKNRGYFTQVSPDGLTWHEDLKPPFLPISYVDDVISAFRDARTGEFVAMPKMSTPVFGRLRRSIYSSRSYDFRHWSKPEPALFADRRDDLGSYLRLERSRSLLRDPTNFNVMRTEFYGTGAYSAESCVVGFPFVFTINNNVPAARNQDGVIEVQLAATRDLETWHRPFRTPILPLGEPGEWDCGMILTASQAIDVGDEVRLYYGGMNFPHGTLIRKDLDDTERKDLQCSIGLATWKRDRFVSADAGSDGGTLWTVPMRFAGGRLEINATTKPEGEIRVELLDAAGRPLEGFGLSEPISGDDLRHDVVFPGSPDLASLANQIVTLRFHLRDAELYAFAFRERR